MVSIGLLTIVAIQTLGPMVDVGGVASVISPLFLVFGLLVLAVGSFLAIESFR